MSLFDREGLYAHLRQTGLGDWADKLRPLCEHRMRAMQHGKLPEWIQAWNELPEARDAVLCASGDAITVDGAIDPGRRENLRHTLMRFHPWRKGPFKLFGLTIDSEWRSNVKWRRFADSIPFRGKLVLDVGCGNGYYGWKMLDAGADMVLGCDPSPLYLMQFEAIRRYAPRPERHFVVPISDSELPEKLKYFDLTFSMGVLYHRTSPIDHLQSLWQTLKPGGQLILETLVVQSETAEVLVPIDRYAKMRNVWFIPSISMLCLWLARTGFNDMRVVDVAVTTSAEQRRTDWMTFESLADFLNGDDSSRTIEGYPAPIRAVVSATCC